MKRATATILLACILAASLALAGCGGDSGESSAAETQQTESTAEAASTQAAESDGETVAVDIDAAALATPDIVIEYGDYDAMANLSANIQNARSEGTVVQVDGEVVNYGSSYSIVQPNADGTKRIGTVFVIQGENVAYPQDGQRAKVTGIVGSDETGYTYYIKTLPEFVEVVG